MSGGEAADRMPAEAADHDVVTGRPGVGVTELDVAVSAQSTLGNAPTWDASTSTLIWVDVLSSEVHRYRPADGTDQVITLPQHVGAAKPRTNGGLVLNLRDGIGLRDPDGGLRWLVYWQREGLRGSDAAVDPSGRLWAATTRCDGTPDGWLARVRPDGRATVALNGASIGNGIGWDPEGTRMYYVDSPTGRVDVYDYDDPTGQVTGSRPLCAIADTDGVPEGLCVDADGCVWVAINGAGQVRRYTPAGALDRIVQLPVSQPSGCCFGSDDLADLYVTTARVAGQPQSGSLFVAPGIGSGLPSARFTG